MAMHKNHTGEAGAEIG